MQASGQYGVPPEVPQFVVGRVPSATAAAAASASAHSHMFSLSHDMPVSNSSQQNPNPHPPPPSQQQQQQQQQQMVTQKIRLESDSREVVPSPNLNNSSNNNHNNNNNNNNSNTDSFDKQLVPVGNSEQQQVQVGAGEEDVLDCERGSAGNRWPRQETLALLKIRSEMDANFRDASLKGPLWEDVSRRLAELGYYRSAKKCKEKFENVHKYYKRTKEGRAGRQDGKSYKFFSQLEALYGSSNATINSNHNNNNDGSSNNNGNSNKVTVAAIGGGPGAAAAAITAAGNLHATATAPLGVSTREIINPTSTIKTTTTTATAAAAAAVISNPTAVHRPALDFSAAAAALNFSSDSSSEDEYDEPEESEQTDHHSRKRKRSSSMVAFFENLMKQVIEKQEAMQQKFLEAIEKREQDRMIREEAWKRQEIARLSREHELKSQERSLTATRDAALVAFLQKMTGQTLQIPQLPSIIQPQNIAPPPPPPPPPLPENQHNSDHEHHNQECKELVTFDPNSKRWPKPEVLALIKLRSGMEQRYHEAGPKGPLWEEISQGMAYLGYSRSAKRCKEKWENINKYFRKAKESNKKRPENAKTCPYFHQLDALYRKKILGNPSKQNKIMEQGYEGGGHDQQNKIIMQEDQNLIEPQQQQHCESSREDNSAHTQPGEHGTASAATDILAIMPPPAGSETHAVTYHHERTSSSTTRDASFMAMVQKLAAPDPPEFNMSTSSNTE